MLALFKEGVLKVLNGSTAVLPGLAFCVGYLFEKHVLHLGNTDYSMSMKPVYGFYALFVVAVSALGWYVLMGCLCSPVALVLGGLVALTCWTCVLGSGLFWVRMAKEQYGA